MSEQWKPVHGYEGLYEVSDQGNVRRIRFTNRHIDKPMEPKLLKQHANPKFKYPRVSLSKNGKTRGAFVHVLVLEAFVCPRPAGLETAHMDGCRTNNHLTNLQWTNREENHSHKYIHGTQPLGEKNLASKLTTPQVIEIKQRLKRGERAVDIARLFNCTYQNIHNIKKEYTWHHVKIAND